MDLASSFSPAPIYCAMRTAPATVIPLPKFVMIFCIGVTRLIAASCSVPIFPSQ